MWDLKKHSNGETNDQRQQKRRVSPRTELTYLEEGSIVGGILGALVEGSGHSREGCAVARMYAGNPLMNSVTNYSVSN